MAAAMQVIGPDCSADSGYQGNGWIKTCIWEEPETITGYFGGIGQPNEYALEWIDEYLYYYTHYGIKQVLNINPGTVLLGYILHKLGVDIEFKISVFMGNDNPYSVLWTLMTARLFSRPDGSYPISGVSI